MSIQRRAGAAPALLFCGGNPGKSENVYASSFSSSNSRNSWMMGSLDFSMSL
jgi:hypothetical protein